MNFKIDEHTQKKNTIVICDLITTLDADDTTKTKREEEIPFKVTLMRCVSYKIQMVENKIQHELMTSLVYLFIVNFHFFCFKNHYQLKIESVLNL